MDPQITGLHHVTAIATQPQENVDFYRDILGLRLVKKTVNFDDPGTYHLYYGDGEGSPGTIMTFFPWPQARRGSRGVGQATVTSFSVPQASLGYWADRLRAQNVLFEDPKTRFDEDVLTVLDGDGLKLELVAHQGAEDRPPWAGGGVPEKYAVRGFHSVTLEEVTSGPTIQVLEKMGFRKTQESGSRRRFEIADGGAGHQLDILERPDGQYGRIAAGTVHHVAFRTPDDANQAEWQKEIAGLGLGVTEVRDRQYFRSIYFREPGGTLFEIATDPPGFTFDESVEDLGTGLKLPPWLESRRQEIETILLPIDGKTPAAAKEDK